MNTKFNTEQLDRKILNNLIDMVDVIDKNNIKIQFKNDIILKKGSE